MKIFSWMQSKLNGKQMGAKPNSASATYHKLHESCKEEFSDWPNGLLAIGTFGNNNLKDPGKSNLSCQNQPDDNIPDESAELHKELDILLQNSSDSAEASAEGNLPLEEVSACLQSLQDDKTMNDENCDNITNKEGFLQRTTLACRRGEDVCLDRTNMGIQKKSLSFLLKKAFACAGGFSPAPVLRDTFPEAKLERSRMEKIMRSILHKKIYPQGPIPRFTGKKYLDSKNMYETDTEEDETSEKAGAGSKWVKTDTEYIVLEM